MTLRVTCARCGLRVLSNIDHIDVQSAATLYGHVLACDQRPPGEVVPEREMLGSILRSFDVSREQS